MPTQIQDRWRRCGPPSSRCSSPRGAIQRSSLPLGAAPCCGSALCTRRAGVLPWCPPGTGLWSVLICSSVCCSVQQVEAETGRRARRVCFSSLQIYISWKHRTWLGKFESLCRLLVAWGYLEVESTEIVQKQWLPPQRRSCRCIRSRAKRLSRFPKVGLTHRTDVLWSSAVQEGPMARLEQSSTLCEVRRRQTPSVYGRFGR